MFEFSRAFSRSMKTTTNIDLERQNVIYQKVKPFFFEFSNGKHNFFFHQVSPFVVVMFQVIKILEHQDDKVATNEAFAATSDNFSNPAKQNHVHPDTRHSQPSELEILAWPKSKFYFETLTRL